MYEYVNCIGTIRKHCIGVNIVNERELTLRIEEAIDECIEKGYLADILIEERAGVIDMFLDGCTIEEYVDLQVRDSRAEGHAEGRNEEHIVGLKALINSLKPFLSDIDKVLEAIRRNEGYEETTPDMIKKYWND